MTDFPGVIGTTIAESTPWWPDGRATREGAPNVVLVILDDTGWSDLGCYGSEIATPHIDALAGDGIRFNNFHVLPLCSPTRAALLTGRNNHSIGMRFLSDTDTGFPNSRGAIRPDVPMLPRILRDQGYGTYLVGKWHLAPLHEVTPAGPFRNWPLAKGFDRYYGFLDGCTDQYEPELYADNSQLPSPAREGYHLSEDLADQAIDMLTQHSTFRSGDPFFLQFALGATHAPFQAPREYIDKYIPVFRKGWDATREDRLRRQIATGLVPEGTILPERNDGVRSWGELDDEERDVYAHLQATFAGFLEHADAQIGRVIAHLDELGVRDDTIVLVMSDNGASREGGPHGDVDTNAPYSGNYRPASEQVASLGELGSLTGGAHYPEGWAMAGNTPFRWYKQFVDLGGVRSPLVVSWPGAGAGQNIVREQFVHVIDIAPTLLEVIGVDAATDMDGESMAALLSADGTGAGRGTQYWETLGHRALWHDGWRAVTAHRQGDDYGDDTWRLYDTRNDFSEANDVSAEHPEKLDELQQIWWREAAAHDVFPLDDRPLRVLIRDRGPVGLFAQDEITLRPGRMHVPYPSGVTGSNRHIDLVAHRTEDGRWRDGVIVNSGNAQGGYLLHIAHGQLIFEHSHLKEGVVIEGPVSDAEADTIGFRLRAPEDGSGTVEVFCGGDVVASGRIPRVTSHLSFWGLDVGRVATTTFSSRVVAEAAGAMPMLQKVVVHVHPAPDDLEEYAQSVLGNE